MPVLFAHIKGDRFIDNPTYPRENHMLTDEYVKRVYAQVEQRDGDQPEFCRQ